MVYDARTGQADPVGIEEVANYLLTVGLTRAQAYFLANAAIPSEGWVATEAAARVLGFHYQTIRTDAMGDCQSKFCLAIPP